MRSRIVIYRTFQATAGSFECLARRANQLHQFKIEDSPDHCAVIGSLAASRAVTHNPPVEERNSGVLSTKWGSGILDRQFTAKEPLLK